jgi:hypothetical protein
MQSEYFSMICSMSFLWSLAFSHQQSSLLWQGKLIPQEGQVFIVGAD